MFTAWGGYATLPIRHWFVDEYGLELGVFPYVLEVLLESGGIDHWESSRNNYKERKRIVSGLPNKWNLAPCARMPDMRVFFSVLFVGFLSRIAPWGKPL